MLSECKAKEIPILFSLLTDNVNFINIMSLRPQEQKAWPKCFQSLYFILHWVLCVLQHGSAFLARRRQISWAVYLICLCFFLLHVFFFVNKALFTSDTEVTDNSCIHRNSCHMCPFLHVFLRCSALSFRATVGCNYRFKNTPMHIHTHTHTMQTHTYILVFPENGGLWTLCSKTV